MALLETNVRLRAYDHIAPLFLGDVATDGIKLNLNHRPPLTLQMDERVDIAEVSLNRYLVAYARGDRSLVGIPAFILRGFRHRNFFVRADSPLQSLADLRNCRIGTDAWPDTGTMWARAAMRDAGVDVGDVDWVIGQLDPNLPRKPPGSADALTPRNLEFLPESDFLVDALLSGRLDAVTVAFAPDEVFKPGGRIRRLVRDYRAVERDYFQRTGIYPPFHIVAARRDFAEANPWVLPVIYDALKSAFDLWVIKVKRFAEATPWAMEEMETMLHDFAGHTPPFGMDLPAHRAMMKVMCEEHFQQGLVTTPADPASLFADFEAIAAAHR